MLQYYLQIRRIPESLAKLMSLCQDVKTLFVRLRCSIEHAETHQAKAEAVYLRTIATQLSFWERHVEYVKWRGEFGE